MTAEFKRVVDRVAAAANRFDRQYRLSQTEASADYVLATELREYIGNEPDRLTRIESEIEGDLWHWLLELPFELARHGLVDEAAVLGAAYAEVTETENFLGDRAVILAEAGRRDEALAQVEDNLIRFPVDPWIRIKAGDVYAELGEVARAEALYSHGLEYAGNDQYTRDGAIERLLPLLEKLGRSDEADALVAAEEAWRQKRQEDFYVKRVDAAAEAASERPKTQPGDRMMVRTSPKICRNDPCPCGSGKKYKKCCLTEIYPAGEG